MKPSGTCICLAAAICIAAALTSCIASTTISEATTTTATITLYPNCPLYIIHNGALLKILQEITFMPFVWDWE